MNKDGSSSTDSYQNLLKEFLKAAYFLTLKEKTFSADEFSKSLNRTVDEGKALLAVLKSMQFIKSVLEPPNHYQITTGGRNNLKIVMTGGVFDIIHLGHLKALKEAKNRGDILVVIIAADETVKSNKGRPPINSQENRKELLSHFDIVDIAEKGSPDPKKFLDIVGIYQPDIIALGYDQSLTEVKLSKLLQDNELNNIEVIRLQANIPNEKTSLKIKNIDEHSFE
ncbi:MAG: adenylyltransferase/cytidyltransferase family protein [Candidatus Hodarchaeota archaeon]